MENEPDRARIALWVAALRDPGARQAKRALTRADGSGDCCLGIACKVAIANGLDLETREGSLLTGEGTGMTRVIAYGPDDEKSFLPLAVQLWFGFPDHDPIVGVVDVDDGTHRVNVSATQANDHRKLTFAEIADLLEECYLTPGTEPVTV